MKSDCRDLAGWRRVVLSLLLAGTAIDLRAAGVEELVVARPGNLPVILVAPHGGREAVNGVRVRTSGKLDMDARTLELTGALAQRLHALLGAEPYVVAAKFHRRYIDANRSEAEAFEDPAARPAYLAYHDHIRRYVAEVGQRYPRGALLFDIHGQSTDVDTVHRGTNNGATVARMLRQHGPGALIGSKSVFGVLQAKGRTVFPPNSPIGKPREDPRYNGGYTVRTYGSDQPGGIDAIQLEIGANLRRTAGFIDDLAEAIAVYCRTYLLPGG
jgi:N-formylglutamate amidohydrolase